MATELTCPKCKQNTAVCTYKGDIGGSDWYMDLFEISCTNPDCGYSDSQQVSQGGVGMEHDELSGCPYCGNLAKDHSN